jgi:uncharacterized protein (DUF2267 family)
VDDEDLLARVQYRGRLHGRNESRRAVRAVAEAVGEFLSPRAFHLLAEQLPGPVRHHPSPVPVVPTSRTFLARIAQRLHMDGPDAAFTARIVLEELNATGRVITPARFAHLVAADLRPLLCARRAPVTANETNPAPRRVIRVSPAPARPSATPAVRPSATPAVRPSATPAVRPSAVPAETVTVAASA